MEALLRDEKMERKAKKRKLRKFKEAYPDMWRYGSNKNLTLLLFSIL